MFGVNRMLGELQQHETALAASCRVLEPAAVPAEHVAAVYETLARIEKLAAGARVRLAARLASSSSVWRQTGHRHAADWLAATAGITAGAAQAELAASTLLASLPAVDDALRHGRLSTVQAAAISEAAAAAPPAESRLLEH